MVEKINKELEKLLLEKSALENGDLSFIEEKVAEYKAQLIAEYNAEKDTKLAEVNFKISVLQDWKDELEKAPVEEVVEPCEEVVEEQPTVEETPAPAPIVY